MLCKVKVEVKARKESVRSERGIFYISVKEPAERGAANTRVRQLLAKHYDCNQKAIRIISGHHRASKMIEVKI